MNRKNKPDPGSPFAGLKDLRDKMAAAAAPDPKKTVVPAKKAVKGKANATPAEEQESFHRLMSGVTPLGESSARKRAEADKLARAEADAAESRLQALVVSGLAFEVTDDGQHVEGRRLDVTPVDLRKLRRGMFPVDARLDLHGRTAEEAEREVEAFLAAMRARGERCVLLIVGRGEHSPGGRAVLRGEVSAWLSQGASKRHVAAFASATQEDGGQGAVYVLLAKRG